VFSDVYRRCAVLSFTQSVTSLHLWVFSDVYRRCVVLSFTQSITSLHLAVMTSVSSSMNTPSHQWRRLTRAFRFVCSWYFFTSSLTEHKRNYLCWFVNYQLFSISVGVLGNSIKLLRSLYIASFSLYCVGKCFAKCRQACCCAVSALRDINEIQSITIKSFVLAISRSLLSGTNLTQTSDSEVGLVLKAVD